MNTPSLTWRIATVAGKAIVAVIGLCCVAELLFNIGLLIGNLLAPILQ